MMSSDENALLGHLARQWNDVKDALQRINPNAQVRAEDLQFVFKLLEAESENVANFSFGPVFFKLPERGWNTQIDMYVAVEGLIGLRRDSWKSERIIKTDSFSSKAAYFRYKAKTVEHVYGAHFDFALDEIGHPAFHSQLRSYGEMWPSTRDIYRLSEPENGLDDHVSRMLHTVRIPSAQVDVLSLCLQIFADHLLHKDSNIKEIQAFNGLLLKGTNVRGAGFQVESLSKEETRTCYRALHWYPAIG